MLGQTVAAGGEVELKRKQGRWRVAALLIAILVVGGYLRFTALNWDEGRWIHPDEGHMRTILSVIEIPESLRLYLDTHRSPLNCRNRGHTYSYGTLPLFLTRAVAEGLDRVCAESSSVADSGTTLFAARTMGLECEAGAFTGSRGAEVGRALSALADLGTLCVMYLVGRRLYGEPVGILATALGALTALSIQQAHFFTVDSMATFFVALTGYFAVRASHRGSWGGFALAGLLTGFSAACKVIAAPASALLVVLAAIRWSASREPSGRHQVLVPVLSRLVVAGLLSFVAFRIAQPYAFEGPGLLGLRPSPEWLGRLGQIRREQSGQVDSPPGQQWTGRVSLLFPWVNMVFWGMGLPLGLTVWAGWAVAGFELFRRRRLQHLVLWGWTTVFFLYLGTRWVKSMRYFFLLYPFYVILGAYLLCRVCRVSSRWGRRLGYTATIVVVGGTLLWAAAVFSIYLRPHTRLAASRWIFENVPAGSTVANEHWDWGVPLGIDGHDPFGGMYEGFEMQHYHEDTPEKREQLFSWLDRADYIFTASNRIYASVARLPDRYPLTIAYYRALFAEELGFELMADFTSRPALGPFQFPDQETPYPLVTAEYVHQREPVMVRLPPAEEAFSVYDHPRVLVFRKTEDYSRERVEEALGGIDVERAIHGLTPVQSTAAPDLLAIDAETWVDQQAGGTWSSMFDRDSLMNRYPGLAAIAWWVVVSLLGWLAFPLLFVALPHLGDRGYGLARVLGLLLVAYLTWLAASLRLLPNTRGTALRMVALLALVGGGVGWLRRHQLLRFARANQRVIWLIEGLGALLYVVWIGVRLLQPDLWHPIVGGEKPMDFAYLNAVMKSTWFPPYNPWLSGSIINYYYFGFVIVGTLVKLMGTVPAIAYNLAVPLIFALTGVGSFSAAYNLFGGHKRGRLLAGVTAMMFTVLLGNLGVVRLIRNSLIKLGGELFPSTIPGFPEAVAMLRGLWELLARGAKLPLRIESWYWNPTRIIPFDPGEVGPITEFPAFTFLYGDLHAHMVAFLLALLVLTLAAYWARTSRPHWGSLLLGGLAIGGLYPTNTWDYPTYLSLAFAALAVGAWGERDKDPWGRVQSFAVRAAVLLALTVILYVPYLRHYATGYSSIEVWEGSRTPVETFLWIHGIVLLPLLTRLLIETRRLRSRIGWKGALLGLSGLAVITLALFYQGYQVALIVAPTVMVAALLVCVPWMAASRRLLWLMVSLAMVLSLIVEVVVLAGDLGRMNTVFKFYLQVWILLGVVAGVSVAWVREHARRWSLRAQRAWWTAMGLLVFGGALFLPFGVRARAADRMSPRTGLTLDGMAFMRFSQVSDGDPARDSQQITLAGDHAAIRWMQDRVQGSPVILEGLGHREYLWGSRVSIYTGLPAVLGWRWHQVQQRAALPDRMVDWRRRDVGNAYDSTSVAYVQEILARYGVRYIYVGAYERAYYDPSGLRKFDDMVEQDLLTVAYDSQGVRIYEIP